MAPNNNGCQPPDWERINKIERDQLLLKERFDQHQRNFERHITATEDSVKALNEAIKAQKEATDGLKETLKMLQYLIMGAIFTLIATKGGLLDAIKAFM